MNAPVRWAWLGALFLALSPLAALAADDEDVASVPAQDLRAGKDEHKRFFLIGPRKDQKAPKDGFGLVVVLPGGSGDADFHPFVKRLAKHAVPDNYLMAQLVAVQWAEGQEVVWPTEKNKVEQMKFTTEEFVAAVIDDVAARHALDPRLVFTLAWSSGGPAAYAVSLTNPKVTGSFVAMSVFKTDLLPPLEKAKGRAYYLFHSAEDRVCPYRMAEQAQRDLKKQKANVILVTYDGGHGWQEGVYDDVRAGVAWLEKNHAEPPGK